jgi:hypothetical protein
MDVYLLMRERILCFTTWQIYGDKELLLFGCFFAGMIPLNVLARRRFYISMICQSSMKHLLLSSIIEANPTPSCIPIKKSENIVYIISISYKHNLYRISLLRIQSPLSSIHNLLDLLHTLINNLFHLRPRLFQIIRSRRLCQLHGPQLFLLPLSRISDCIVGYISCFCCCIDGRFSGLGGGRGDGDGEEEGVLSCRVGLGGEV